MINEKSYQIIAVDILGNTEVICTCLTYDIAENLLFKLQEGDDKFSPCAYTIEEITNEG
jgi:hypothetical protein